MDQLIDDQQEPRAGDLGLSTRLMNTLQEGAGWARFLAIVGFVFLGFLLLGAVAAALFLDSSLKGIDSSAPEGLGILFAFMYLLLGVVYFFPVWYMYRFATLTKQAIASQNGKLLESAFVNQTRMYRFYGVMVIIILGVYVLTGVVVLTMGVM